MEFDDRHLQVDTRTVRLPGLLDMLRRSGYPERDLTRMYPHLMWALAESVPAEEAIGQAAFADIVQQSAGDVANVSSAVGRDRSELEAGQSRDHVGYSVVNLGAATVQYAARDLQLIAERLVLPPRRLTVVLDDELAPQARGDVLTLPVSDEDDDARHDALSDLAKGAVDDGLIEALASSRSLSGANLADEQQLRARRARTLLEQVLGSVSAVREDGETFSLSTHQAQQVVTRFEQVLSSYTRHPRVALACRSLVDLAPAEDAHRHGTDATRALVERITGHDPLVSATLAGWPTLRVGQVCLTGDPDDNGDDLLSATLEPAACQLILTPQASQRALYLPGPLLPGRRVKVPHEQFGFYNAAATADSLQDMICARAMLSLTPAVGEDVRAYLRGQTQELSLLPSPTGTRFHGVMAVANELYEPDADATAAEEMTRTLVGSALFSCLARSGEEDCISAVIGGPLGAADIEQVVVPVRMDQFVTYRTTAAIPESMQPLSAHLGDLGIQLRLAPPAEL